MRKYFEMDKMWYYLNWSEAPVVIDNSQTDISALLQTIVYDEAKNLSYGEPKGFEEKDSSAFRKLTGINDMPSSVIEELFTRDEVTANISSAEENASENDFKTFLQEDAETKDYRESEIDAFIAFTKIIRSISNGGAYISVACDEADNPETLYHWAKLTKRGIRLYANSNYSSIDFSEDNATYNYYDERRNLISVNFPGSILNIPLTEIGDFKDRKGWCYLRLTSGEEVVATGKDLILNSIGSNIVSLVDPSLFPKKRRAFRHLSYSNTFKEWLIKNRGKSEYSNWVEIAKREI